MPPKRGPYKRYLHDDEVPIPRVTAWRRVYRPGNIENQNHELQPDEQHDASDSDNSMSSMSVEMNDDAEMPASDTESSGESENEGIAVDPANDLNIPLNDENLSDRSGDSSDSEESIGHEHAEVENDPDPVSDGEEEGNGHIDGAQGRFIFGNQLEEEEVDRGPPLYRSCPLTTRESDLLIMSFLVRWGLEDKCIDDLLKLIDSHLPCSVMGSKYLFLKKFPALDLSKLRYTCPACSELLPQNFEEINCPYCNLELSRKALYAGGNYFLEFSIERQLKSLVENETVSTLLRKECREKDVISGSVYRDLRHRGVIGDNDLTLQWNTDGVSPFETTNVSVWPIQACVNELPYYARRKHMILCGLHFSNKKPCMNSFLKPFVEELEHLHLNGFECQLPGQDFKTTVKVHTLIASVDSTARPLLQNIKQFNGSYGCRFCLRRGRRVARGKGFARIYEGGRAEYRTLRQHINAIQVLHEHRQRNVDINHVQGVKGPSVLLLLSVFNITSSFVPDYLHCVLEGVVKTFITHWINGQYKQFDWYLTKEKRDSLSEKLKAISPPVEVTRVPRGLDKLKFMTASEFRNFLLYYSLVCLKDILPAKYLKHWFLLVYAMTIYLQEDYSELEAVTAKRAINKFVEEIATVYPGCLHLYTFNVHLLLHIPRATDSFGGLWASSTFGFEHFNGVLSRWILGTRHVPEQMSRSYQRLQQVSELGQEIFSHPASSPQGRQLFQILTAGIRTSKTSHRFDRHVRLFGAPENYVLSLVEKVTIQQFIGQGEINPFAQSFRRMFCNDTIYHASAYETLTKRNNSVIKMQDGRTLYIKRILVIEVLRSHNKLCIITGEEYDYLNEELCSDRDLNLSSRALMQVCVKGNRISCGFPQHIMRKCIPVPYGNGECIIPLVNLVERD